MKHADKDIYSSSRKERQARERSRSRLQVIFLAVAGVLIVAAVVSFFAISMNQPAKEGASSSSAASSQSSTVSQEESTPSQEESTPSQPESSAAASSESSAAPSSQSSSSQSSSSRAESSSSAASESGASQAESSAAESSESSSSSSAPTGHVEEVDGQRVYVDTKHAAPEKTGTALLVTATGETSYSFDWDYSTDNKNFQLSCNYVFDTKTYQFSIYGVAPGTSHIDLVYYTADDKKETMPLTIQVDDQLNVSRVS